MMTKIFYFFCLILLSCNRPSGNTNPIVDENTSISSLDRLPQEDVVNSNVKVTYKIINAVDSTFGYDIFINGKKFIHQPVIPAAVGNQGFKCKKDAQVVAKLIMDKIKLGEMPPTVSFDEIENLTQIR